MDGWYWAVGGIVVGLIIGGAFVAISIVSYLARGMGQAFGYPSKPWWKFWR